MRVFSFLALTEWRPRSAIQALAIYAFGVSVMCGCLVWVTGTLLRQAEAPVSKLMQLGDTAPAGVTSVPKTSVLEGDAWMESLKNEHLTRDRSRGSAALPGGSGLFGPGGVGSAAARFDNLLNESRTRRSGKQPHRTVCVRLCDGYFWPISYATSEDQFQRDQGVCENACSSPAKLYVFENPGQEPEQMVSLKGQPYAKLPTAFQFRNKLDQSCKCNPHPWEQEAMDRHRRFAEEADRKKLTRKADANLPAAKDSRSNGKLASDPASMQLTAVAPLLSEGPAMPRPADWTTPSVRFTPGPAFISAGKPALGEVVSSEMIAESSVGIDTVERTKSKKPKLTGKRRSASASKALGGKTASRARVLESGLMRLGVQTSSRTAGRYVEYQSDRKTRDWRVAIFMPR